MPHRPKNVMHIAKCLPRMSWSPANLYNLYQRTYGPPTAETKFTKSALTLFQQKWKAKQLVRAYHGDWIQEDKFKKQYLPDALPPLVNGPGGESGRVPLASMMFAELEKRVDVVVFRSCFAHSVYRARMMVIHGKVSVNGKKVTDPNLRLSPGDLISVDPSSVTTLNPPNPHEAAHKQHKAATDAAQAAAAAEAPIDAADPSPSTSAPPTPAPSPNPTPTPSAAGVLPFHLPDYAAPFLFIPPYLEPSFQTCSVVYLRHPTAGPGRSEVPTPYEADGEVMRLAWEYYSGLGRKGDKRPAAMVGKRLGA